METTNDVIIYEGKNIQPQITAIISEMLEKYTHDDLVDLLCECEMLLQTNDTYLKKLNERGFKRLFNLLSGIERKTKLRLLNNFQILHTITLNIQKNIISRINDLTALMKSLDDRQKKNNIFMQRCINFLRHKVVDVLDKKVDLLEWFNFDLGNYISYSATKKVLQTVSDIYVITKGNCEVRPNLLNSAMDRLELADVKISPGDFAKEIIQDSDCLPLYMKDGLNYDSARHPLSDFGGLIFKAHKWVMNPDIQDLLVGPNDSIETLCLPPLKKLIADKNINAVSASELCRQLLEDLKNLYEDTKSEPILSENKSGNGEPQVIIEKPNEPERNYSLFLLSPTNWLECSLGKKIEYGLKPTDTYAVDEINIVKARERISMSKPAVIIKSDGISEEELGVRNSGIHIASIADLCFFLWYKERKQTQTAATLVDYYNHTMFVSCYMADDAGKVSKFQPFTIKYTRSKKHIVEDIEDKEKEFFKAIPSGAVERYRLFESEKWINTKLEKKEIPFIGNLWKKSICDKLRDAEELKESIDFLYDHDLPGFMTSKDKAAGMISDAADKLFV